MDVAEPSGGQKLVDACVREFGRVDILVNNAGLGINRRFVDFPLEEWERVIRVNLTGGFLCAQAAARRMMQQKRGKIINIVSLSGQRGGIGRAAYGASKAGLELLNKVMAVELAEHGINVNAIAPGPIATELAGQDTRRKRARRTSSSSRSRVTASPRKSPTRRCSWLRMKVATSPGTP